MILSEWLPQDFFQDKHPEIQKFLECLILAKYNYIAHYHNNNIPWNTWAGKHKDILNWCIIAHKKKHYAIGWRAYPHRNWRYFIKKLTVKYTKKVLDLVFEK